MSKKPAPTDWHKADVIAALHKRDLTLIGLSKANGYHTCNAVSQALHRTYPKVERIIAVALDLQPQQIWPSRYHPDGTPRSGRNERGVGRFVRKADRIVKANHTSVNKVCNVNVQG